MTVILDYKEFVFGTEKLMFMFCSDAGRWKTLGVPVVICGDNLSSLVGIGWTDLPNMGGGAVAPLPPSCSGITALKRIYNVHKYLHKKSITYITV